MSKTNCVNCGSAKDTTEIKCPFCGTTYLDFTAIDFSSKDPVVCEFVLPFAKERTIMQMVAIPHLNEISTEPIYCSFDDAISTRLKTVNSWEMKVGVSFTPISRKGVVYSIKKEDGEMK